MEASISNEQPTSTGQSSPNFDTNIHGNVQQLVQIAQVHGSVNFFSQALLDKLLEAISAQGTGVGNPLQMREAVAQVLALLRSKNALYAALDDEYWEYVFKSLRELRDALALAGSKLHVSGPRSVKSLLDLMVEAIREYLGKHETNYNRFMQAKHLNLPSHHREREWPELPYASRDLLCLRDLLIAAIEPLNMYAEEGQAVHWDEQEFESRKHDIIYSSSRHSGDTTPAQEIHSATPSALDTLKDSRDWVRWTAVDALNKRSNPTTVAALVEALNDNQQYIRQRAADILCEIGNPVVPNLIEALKSKQGTGRQMVAHTLGIIRDASAVPGLLEALSDDDQTVREEIAQALDSIRMGNWVYGGSPPESVETNTTIPMLLERLRDKSKHVRSVAAKLLGDFGDASAVPSLLEALGDVESEDDVRWAAAEALGQIGDASAVPGLLEAALSDELGLWLRSHEALSRIGSPLPVSRLLQALQDVSKHARWMAAKLLEEFGDASVVSKLVEALRDDDGEVREQTAKALGKIGDLTAIPDLVEAALSDNGGSWRMYGTIKEALNQIGGRIPVPKLLEVLRNENTFVRCNAAKLLGDFGGASAVPSLLEALQDDDREVCRAAVEALGKIGDASAVPGLLEVLRDEYLHDTAAEALGKIGDPTAIPKLVEALSTYSVYWHDGLHSTREALSQIGGSFAVPKLLEALGSENRFVRYRAIYLLGEFGDTSIIPSLIEVIWDNEREIQNAAVEALGKIGDPAAVPALVQLLESKDVWIDGVLGALRNIGPSAIPTLQEALKHSDQGVRTTIADILKDLRVSIK